MGDPWPTIRSRHSPRAVGQSSTRWVGPDCTRRSKASPRSRIARREASRTPVYVDLH